LFSNFNSSALVKKAELLYEDKNYDLTQILSLLEKSELTNVSDQYLYILTLYRLKEYLKIKLFIAKLDLNIISDADTIFYIADSLIRTGDYSKALKIIELGFYQTPDDLRFYELHYLVTKSKKTLKKLRESNISTASYLRLYNRIEDSSYVDVINYYLLPKLEKLNINELKKLTLNFKLLPTLLSRINIDTISGKFLFDNDSDTFPEIILKVKNGVLESAYYDRNQDRLNELEIFFDNGKPVYIIKGDNRLVYSRYPYVSKILLGKDELKEYLFYSNATVFHISNITEATFNPEFISVVSSGKLKMESIYNKDKLIEQSIYRDSDTVLRFSDVKDGVFSRCSLIVDQVIVSGLRDIDSSGNYDSAEFYTNGILTGIEYVSVNGDNLLSYFETYLPESKKEWLDSDAFDNSKFNWHSR